MLDEKEKLLKKNSLFSLRKKRKKATAYEKAKVLCCTVAVFLSLTIIGLIYFISDVSNIYHIDVRGNYYLSDKDILTLSGLDDDSKYLFTIPFVIEKRIKENNIIEECKVSLLDNRLVRIEVQEKKIIGYALENGLYVLVLNNGERSGLNNDNLYLISKVPLIEGFDDEELRQIEKRLGECDREVIDQISEIHKYPQLKYQNLELVMVDGNYIFTSIYGLNILEKYYDIESSYVSDRKQCYYFEDISGNAYTSACPWEEVEEAVEEQAEETEEEE
ncbi:MAG: FtsQ-type POTRA domain-containing protein [Erysipelotrichaceae bacterium]|nr:FtsQ-type POTRA domain-containing protein [Erysipelotrichaceae bacterium]